MTIWDLLFTSKKNSPSRLGEMVHFDTDFFASHSCSINSLCLL